MVMMERLVMATSESGRGGPSPRREGRDAANQERLVMVTMIDSWWWW